MAWSLTIKGMPVLNFESSLTNTHMFYTTNSRAGHDEPVHGTGRFKKLSVTTLNLKLTHKSKDDYGQRNKRHTAHRAGRDPASDLGN